MYNFSMQQVLVSTSAARKNLPHLISQVDELGKIVVLTVHGKKKIALIDIDLLEQFIENSAFGISEKELLKRSREKRVSMEYLKKSLNV